MKTKFSNLIMPSRILFYFKDNANRERNNQTCLKLFFRDAILWNIVKGGLCHSPPFRRLCKQIETISAAVIFEVGDAFEEFFEIPVGNRL